ncbi:APC family permease [Clavibacter michiganensis subsp. michiganensis]|uniref:APC family permease n=1 Tax=Clavibacter michiganensis TaxID=28447 RepID=UPI001D0A44FB|nr:APC family permease [Clavibacter michiganensis]UDM09633.1 APC family permease [Clavibacter michiganensis subsp. michiganensis]WDD24322.1 APC family permease [Clavibacter michiganensis subsp. michiganensis]WDD27432.1 APC family permease [Clavibacter michiganensis subsp. michiganensis]
MTAAAESASAAPQPGLARRLGLLDATVLGLGAMIGAGIFAVMPAAARAAGGGLLVGLAIAAVVAFCNATASAQLAARYPSSGGSYLYGRERLGKWPGFLAGWSFVIGKTASCAAMALTFAAYAVPAAWQRPVSALAVVALAIVGCLGVTRTARLARVIIAVVLAVIALVLVAGLVAGGPHAAAGPVAGVVDATPYGVLQSAGLLFFAFAGYARIATMGEEVRDPARTIPRAILLALGGALVVYALVAVTLLGLLGDARLGGSTAPLADVVRDAGWAWAVPVVGVGAAAACLGALLALLAGIGRTSLAMAREGDLPRALAVVHPRYRVPQRAEIVVAAVVVALVLTVDLRGVVGFSSFGVLLYYVVANAAAFTQERADRRYPRALQALGVVGCLVLVATLPGASIAVGAGVLLVGVVGRAVVLARRRRAAA